MPEVVLQGPRVVAIVGQLKPAGMAKHVWMDREWHLGGLTDTLDEAMEFEPRDRTRFDHPRELQVNDISAAV